ncbi:uncharacterized protein SPAPADRAFT_58904 [Spathaspora passalidarum NRRL Y-27907]|uniref:Uncharacterized protein n=1 Tax=Spathaspora passalidarum (strain NRRL Y-27907 / 11-Y1) TaxID=619300 RepID=G3AES5_SPAPN|nr:uncharacterized protein SPAPADRAFT_58904 [Spathaspora passalidarum NRRL Y-27907]EGW35701.1 hypothetical protein SPAPADRAFT_58904 [Spathaspora passalidarum NRRL Y-27907]
MTRFIKSEDIDNHSYLLMFHRLFSIDPALLSGDDYVKALDIINFKQEKELSGKILDYINESKIDQEAENLRLRVKILECLGIADDNIEVALQKYHQYRTHATYGLHIVSTAMVKVFGYQAIKQDKNIYSTIAATLVPQDTITVKILQTLIVTKGYFDKDSALELFNDYINQVSADVNQATRRSAKGLLTEAVCLSSLQNNDRSFAQLVFDKAIDNNVISDEHEIAAVKKVFKAYGDSFIEDDDWSKAKVNMNSYVLNYIKNL